MSELLMPAMAVGGWIVGALIVVVGMREQVKNLTTAIDRLREDMDAIFNRMSLHERRLSYLEGRYGRRIRENGLPDNE